MRDIEEIDADRIDQIKTTTCKCVYVDANVFDYFHQDQNDVISMTEWTNGEGVDIELQPSSVSHKDERIQLSYGELDAIMALLSKLNQTS